MRITLKRTLALVLALMLAMPTFAFADGTAAQDANGQVTANELVLNDSPALDDGLLPDDDLLLDGDLVLDGLSPELTQPDDPTGDLELGSQDPAEGGAGEQPDASEAGAPGESPLELGDDAQVTGEEIPDPQPLMPPDYALDTVAEGENVTDPAMAANDDTSDWEKLKAAVGNEGSNPLEKDKHYIAKETDTRLLKTTNNATTLQMEGSIIDRALTSSKSLGGVIGVGGGSGNSLTITGNGQITGGNTTGNGGGVELSSTFSGSNGDGYLTMTGSTITGNHANGNGGGVMIDDKSVFNMTGGTITDNSAGNNGGGVYVGGTFSIGKDSETSTIKITGNKKGDAANNVYLPEYKKIDVEGQLSNESFIGVTTERKPNGTNGYIPITWSFSSSFVDEGKVFQSDDTQYEVGVIHKDNVKKQLGLGVVIKHKAEDVSVPYDGKDHGLKVNVTVPSDSDQTVVKYKNAETGQYDQTTNPTFKQVGIYTVEYEISNSDKVSKPYCFPVQAKHTVTITPVVNIEGWTYGQSQKTPTVDQASLPTGVTPTYEYFTDDTCNTKTTPSDNGASAEGGVPKYAGTYYVRATVTVDSKSIQSKPKAFTIARAKATVTATDKSKTYGESDPTLEATVSGLVKGDTASLAYTLSRAEGENAGTYAITPAGNKAQGNYEVTFEPGTLTINPKTLNNDDLVITLDPAEYTYDGTAKTPDVTVTDKDNQKTVPAGEYKVAYSDNVKAGTANVTITDVADGNYIVNGSKTFTINSASMTFSAKGYKGEYDGEAHGITVTVTKPSTGYTIKYGTKEGTYDKDSLTYTNVGNYTVYYQVTAKNYKAVTGSAKVEITTKELDNDTDGDGNEDADSNVIITLDPAEYTYDGTAKKPAVTVKDKKTGLVVPEKEYEVAYSNNVNAGTATVTVSDKTGGNYNVSGVKTFTINKAAMTVSARGYDEKYDGKAHGITVNVTDPKTGYTVEYGTKEGTYGKDNPTYTDIGVYTVYYKVTADNYETVTGSATVEITAKEKAAMTVSASGYKGEYDGEAHGITVTVTEPKSGYTVEYGTKEGTYGKDNPTYTDAGVYTVYYRVTAENYKTVTGSEKVEITARELDNDPDGDGIEDADGNVIITLDPAEYTYDGTAKKPAVTVKDKKTGLVVPEKEYEVAYSNNVNAGTATATISDVSGGNYAVKGVKTFTINKAAMTVSASGYDGKYDGKAHGITVTVTDPKSGYTIKYGTKKGTYGKDNPTYTDIGVYTVYYQVTADNYETVTGSATVEITAEEKAAMTVSAKGYKGEYDGKAHGITVTVTEPKSGYTVRYGAVEGTYDKDSLTYTDAGKYTVYYQVTAKNYKTATGSATVEITTRELDNDPDGDGSEDDDSNVIITLDPAEYTYDGTPKEPAVTVKDKDTRQVVPAGEYKVTYSDNVNAGTAKVTISDVKGGNYAVSGVKTFTIKKAAMTVSASGYKGEYDGKAHGITVNVTDPKDGYTVKYGAKEGACDSDSLTYTDAGKYAVYYQVTAKNYKTATGSATVEITAKELDNDPDGDGSEDDDSNVVITLDPAEYTYDGTPKEPAVTVKDKDTKQVVPAGEYKVTYSDNVNAGTAKVTISDVKGGNYAVNGVKTFTIKKAAMTVSASGYKGEYDGKAHGITVNVTDPKDGYTVKYGEKDGTYDKDSLTYTDAGVYTVYYKVIATNYVPVTGSANVEITAKEDKLTIELGKSEYTYNGEGKRPSVTVKYDGKVVPATEYKVTYSNNKHAGTAKVTISDVPGGQYTVSGNKTFTILPKTVSLKWKSTAFVYDGDEHVPTAKAKGLVKKDKCKVSVSGAATEAGNHTARATKLSNPDYALPKKATKVFIISARGTDSGDTTFSAEKQTGTVTYDGTPQEPKFVVHCTISKPNGLVSNRVLTVPASEYRIVYRNNVNAGTATVVVTDVPGGNFEVNCRTEFTIARRKVTVTAKDQDVKTVDDVKTGVKAVKVQGLIKGHVLESVKLDVDIKAGTKKGRIIPGKAKIVNAEGKDVTKNYKFDYVAGSLAVAQKYDPEPKPAKPDFTLLAQMKTCGHRALRVTWTRVPEADGYDLTFVKKDYSSKKAKVVTVRGQNTWKFTGLEKNTAYMAIVRAWKNEGSKRTYIGKSSPVVCAITGDVDKHNTNAGSVHVSASRLKLNVGKKAKVKTAVKGVKSGKDVMRWDHALLRWYSDNANVATVNAKGEIRAVAPGECTVYALAANGVRGAVKVKVK